MTTFAEAIADIYDRLDELEARSSLLARLKRLDPRLKRHDAFGQGLRDVTEPVDEANDTAADARRLLARTSQRLDRLEDRLAIPIKPVGEFSHDASPCSRCGAPSVGETSGRGGGIDAPATEGCAS